MHNLERYATEQPYEERAYNNEIMCHAVMIYAFLILIFQPLLLLVWPKNCVAVRRTNASWRDSADASVRGNCRTGGRRRAECFVRRDCPCRQSATIWQVVVKRMTLGFHVH